MTHSSAQPLKNSLRFALALATIFTIASASAQTPTLEPYPPSDADMIPEARKIFDLFFENYGSHTLSGIRGITPKKDYDAPERYQNDLKLAMLLADPEGKEDFQTFTDLPEPNWHIIHEGDLCTYAPAHAGPDGELSAAARERGELLAQMLVNVYKERGAIPALTWHWPFPLQNNGRLRMSEWKVLDNPSEHFSNLIEGEVITLSPMAQRVVDERDITALVTEGTPEHAMMMADLKRYMDILQPLADQNIPILWRPLHEADGFWFWWSDINKPENTVKLWKIVYDYVVNERGFHNLIWVYSAAMDNSTKRAGVTRPILTPQERAEFYPGNEWCDIVGIDLYLWDHEETGTKKYPVIADAPKINLSYRYFFEMMEQIAPGKLISLQECQAMPNVEKTVNADAPYHENFPRWLYQSPWYFGGDDWHNSNSEEWIKATFLHPSGYVLFLDDIPSIHLSE